MNNASLANTKLATTIGNQLLQFGRESYTAVPANTTTNYTVQFPEAFGEIPQVFVSLHGYVGQRDICATTITKTSFVIRIMNSATSTALDCNVAWFAVGTN